MEQVQVRAIIPITACSCVVYMYMHLLHHYCVTDAYTCHG